MHSGESFFFSLFCQISLFFVAEKDIVKVNVLLFVVLCSAMFFAIFICHFGEQVWNPFVYLCPPFGKQPLPGCRTAELVGNAWPEGDRIRIS